MTDPHDMDQCSNCGAWLPAEDPRPEGAEREPCSACGSTKRTKFGKMTARVSVSVTADAKLIISWHEVDRLREKAEYAAALLVAAVNVEFILWENLRRFTPSSLTRADNDVKSDWGQVRSNNSQSVSLGSLLRLARFFTSQDSFLLSPTWDPLIPTMNELRRKIAPERGYFSKLTKLEEPNWPGPCIRQVLEDAKEFCHGNAP